MNFIRPVVVMIEINFFAQRAVNCIILKILQTASEVYSHDSFSSLERKVYAEEGGEGGGKHIKNKFFNTE